MNDRADESSRELSQLFDTTPKNAERIWNEFFPRLVGLVRAKLGSLPKRVYDEEDFALSAMKSFYRARDEGRLLRVDSNDALWRVLAVIATRKVIAAKRWRNAPTHGGGNVSGESAFNHAHADSDCNGIAGIADMNLLPESVDQCVASCEDLLAQLPDDKHRRTAVMRLEGYNNQEIADELQCSVARTKQRLQRVREILGK